MSGPRYHWLVGGAIALGLGIWSMHFVGMLAMQMPMRISYDPWITACSLLLAVVISYFALDVMTRSELTIGRLALAGLLIGLGIAGMHYVGMMAMRLQPSFHYRPLLVLISVIIALVFSWAAIWIALALDDERQHYILLKRCIGSVALGVAVAGMHYVGMNAVVFPVAATSDVTKGLSTDSLFSIVCVFSLCGLVMTLILSTLETRFDRLLMSSNLSLEDANKRLQVLATIDTLTGIPNRNSFIELTNERILRAEQNSQPFSLMFLDLDGFKTINDFMGHAAGDELLRSMAWELLNRVRNGDIVARLGGDEFVILLEGVGDLSDIGPVAANVLERMQKDFVIHGMPLRVTASMGVATYPKDGLTVSALLKSADTAMYDAKQHGRNTYRLFNPEMTDTSARVLRIHRGLADALEKDQFTLAFQPKFGGLQNKLVGAEALIRWRHPELGDLSPMDFIPIAEQTGQIAQISEWVVGEACRQMKQWEQHGLAPLKVAINLSPEQLRQAHYVERILEIIGKYGIESHRIMFEVTESVAMKEPAMAGEVIRQFQKAGFEIALDDFGIGYSSMAYLQQFRVKQLKIDRFFINALDDEGEESQAIVSAMIALAHSLHMTVVAEGVETMTQLEKLNELGCDELQGYLLSKPLNAALFEAFLREQGKLDKKLFEETLLGIGLTSIPPLAAIVH
ncbi:putative bifunctional diguanylate cyclase/phosphodiesterase [Granulicella arctica]|uniref:putative bifunctional diguanylate cyclase/phosphodiesterase n=1 Tax=Granulicella arctica TaxID=940613 RepID=UPI0021E0F6AE|nr:EAL domain-containing protein [Granulicella arctica]